MSAAANSTCAVQGWSSVIPHFSGVDFVSFYIEIPIMIVMYLIWLFVNRIPVIKSKLTDADGSFKRKASTFRNIIEKGGDFAPEKGAPCFCVCSRSDPQLRSQVATISTSPMPAVSTIVGYSCIVVHFSICSSMGNSHAHCAEAEGS